MKFQIFTSFHFKNSYSTDRGCSCEQWYLKKNPYLLVQTLKVDCCFHWRKCSLLCVHEWRRVEENTTSYVCRKLSSLQWLVFQIRLFTEDIGLIANESKIAADVDEIIAFETEFAKIIVPDENRRNRTALYNKRKISDLETLMPIVSFYLL